LKTSRRVSDGDQRTTCEEAFEQDRQEICGEFETVGKVGAAGRVGEVGSAGRVGEVGAVGKVGATSKIGATSTTRPAKCGSTSKWFIGDAAVDNAATTRQDFGDGEAVQSQ
jgi:hypothetical protein